jgi:hypothetical protein
MCPFCVPHKLPLRENAGDARLQTCGTGKGLEVEQVEDLSCDWALRVPEDKGRPKALCGF